MDVVFSELSLLYASDRKKYHRCSVNVFLIRFEVGNRPWSFLLILHFISTEFRWGGFVHKFHNAETDLNESLQSVHWSGFRLQGLTKSQYVFYDQNLTVKTELKRLRIVWSCCYRNIRQKTKPWKHRKPECPKIQLFPSCLFIALFFQTRYSTYVFSSHLMYKIGGVPL